MAPVEKDAFENRLDSEAHQINAVLSATPQTVKVIARKARIEREKRVYEHLYQYLLGKKGYVVHEPKGKDGKWALNPLGLAKWTKNKQSRAMPSGTKPSTALPASKPTSRSLTPMQRRILAALAETDEWTTRKQLKGMIPDSKNYALEMGSPTNGDIASYTLEGMGFVEHRKASDGSPVEPLEYRITLSGRQVIESSQIPRGFYKEVADAAEALEDEGYFVPQDMKDERVRTIREVAQRQGQPQFRQKLLTAYGRKCAVTGCDVECALEAAHIIPYCGVKSDHISNGLLLRADIHTLFDLNLLRIDPSKTAVVIAPELRGTCYDDLHGRQLTLPSKAAFHPSKEALSERWRLLSNK